MKKSTKVFLWIIGIALVGSLLIALLLMSGSSTEETLADNSSVKAILLRVDTPGGGVAASQEIYEEVKSIRDSGKPVVVSMGSLAASGGYYVSCGATRIVANPGTITGSIGVIAMFPNYEKLMGKIGLDMNVIKSGEYKDSGSPFRPMTEQDRKYFQGVVDDSYQQFLDVVSKERKLDIDKLKRFADGRVFTGQQALKLGLVDTLGSFEDAVSIAAKLGGISGKPVVVEERRMRSLSDLIFGDFFSEIHFLEKDFVEQPVLQYRFLK